MSSARPFDPVPVFAALGDGTRLSLVRRLGDGRQHSIAELSTDAEMSRQAVTKHLRVLEGAGLVESSRVGRETRFTLVPAPIDSLREYLQTVSRQWDDALLRLRDFVED